MTTDKKIFQAGNYVISDPCYVIATGGEDGNDWERLIEETGCFGIKGHGDKPPTNWDDGVFTYKGFKCFVSGTAFGDGEYISNKGKKYWVDAGMIGIFPVEAIDKNPDIMGVTFVTFQKEFKVWENKGVFHFGDIIINTN